MTRILYYSVHEALEYDELLLFQSLGYNVFPLGVYFPIEQKANPFRPAVTFSKDIDTLVEIFKATSCRFVFNNVAQTEISKEFVDHFDFVVVMHDVHFIAKNWDKIKHKKVIWRTIGQAIDFYDKIVAPYRELGMNIVRWSCREVLIERYIGHDSIIRGYKDPSLYNGWSGFLSDRFVTFSSGYKLRYPEEYNFLYESAKGCKYKVGGGSNPDIPNTLGLVNFDEQIDIYKEAFCYLYFHSTEIPYTLNFVEAWMVGMPVIVIDRAASIGNRVFKYNEVNDFIIDGVNGFKVKTSKQANSLMKDLLGQRNQAAEVGKRGRQSAINVFGFRRAQEEWRNLLHSLRQ